MHLSDLRSVFVVTWVCIYVVLTFSLLTLSLLHEVYEIDLIFPLKLGTSCIACKGSIVWYILFCFIISSRLLYFIDGLILMAQNLLITLMIFFLGNEKSTTTIQWCIYIRRQVGSTEKSYMICSTKRVLTIIEYFANCTRLGRPCTMGSIENVLVRTEFMTFSYENYASHT